MKDIIVEPFDFQAVCFTAKPASEKGREFFKTTWGDGCLSVEIAKSAALSFERYCEEKGLAL
jgi:hypothetical protein